MIITIKIISLPVLYVSGHSRPSLANIAKLMQNAETCLRNYQGYDMLKVYCSKYQGTFALMSQSIPTGYIPTAGNPRGLAQKTCPGGQDLTFKSFPMAENSTRAGIFMKNESETSKNCVDQIFTGEKNK